MGNVGATTRPVNREALLFDDAAESSERSDKPSMIVADPAGRITSWGLGAELLYGRSADEAIGRHIADVLLPWEQGGNDPTAAAWPAAIVRSAAAAATEQWAAKFLVASREVTSEPELDQVVADALAAVAEALDADAVTMLLADGTGSSIVAHAAHGRSIEAGGRIDAAGEALSGRVLATGTSLLVPDLHETDGIAPGVRRPSFRSYVGVPLVAADRLVGVLEATSYSPGHFSRRHIGVLSFLSNPLAAAIERVRLIEAERTARTRAERAAERLAVLQHLAGALVPAATVVEVRAAAMGVPLVSSLAGASRGIWEWRSDALVPRRTTGKLRGRLKAVYTNDSPAGASVLAKTPAFYESRDELLERWPALAELGIASCALLPLAVRDEPLGLLEVRLERDHAFDAEERELLIAFSKQLSVALQRARVTELERRAADNERERLSLLSRAVGPAELPRPEGVELHAHYQPADDGPVGGDWYDVFELADGRVVLCVGDVAGHGVEAASAMAMIRQALFVYSEEGASPAEALARLQRLVVTLPASTTPVSFATVILCQYDPRTRSFVTASAGHLPWARIRGSQAELISTSGLPVSSDLDTVRPEERVDSLQSSDLVALYSDGLVEVPGESLEVGLGRLAAALSEHADRPLGEVCEVVLDRTFAAERADDQSILLMRVL
jgi:serine phosphatase RsbU (regulator of sigma subunit)/putative methionine-R-sulfoxide reductase with GAF domain